MAENIGYTLHKRFTVKLALTTCKYKVDFVLFCHIYKSDEKLVKSMQFHRLSEKYILCSFVL